MKFAWLLLSSFELIDLKAMSAGLEYADSLQKPVRC